MLFDFAGRSLIGFTALLTDLRCVTIPASFPGLRDCVPKTLFHNFRLARILALPLDAFGFPFP